MQAGDFIEFFRHGYRVRCIQSVNNGHKHKFIRFEPLATEAFKNRTVRFEEILRAWRVCDDDEVEDGRLGGDGTHAVREDLSEGPAAPHSGKRPGVRQSQGNAGAV